MSRKKNPNTRERFLSEGREAFFENGYNNTKVSEIVENAGCKSVRSLYVYFDSKESLFNEIVKDVPRTLEGAIVNPEEFAMIVEKKLSEEGKLVEGLSDLTSEVLFSLL